MTATVESEINHFWSVHCFVIYDLIPRESSCDSLELRCFPRLRPRTHGNVFLRFCIVYCSQGNREQPAHYLKQYKNAGKRFRVYGALASCLCLHMSHGSSYPVQLKNQQSLKTFTLFMRRFSTSNFLIITRKSLKSVNIVRFSFILFFDIKLGSWLYRLLKGIIILKIQILYLQRKVKYLLSPSLVNTSTSRLMSIFTANKSSFEENFTATKSKINVYKQKIFFFNIATIYDL